MLLLVLLLLALAGAAYYLRNKRWMAISLRWLWSARTEWLAVPISVVFFLMSSVLVRGIDPNAGVFDAGVLQVLFVSATQLFVAMTTAQVATAISYRRLFNPSRSKPVCRMQYVALYALYFLGAVVLMASL